MIIWWGGYSLQLSLYTLVGLHVLSCAMMAVWFFARRPPGNIDPLGLALISFMGPLGGLGLLVITAVSWVAPMSAVSREDWYEELAGNGEDDLFVEIHRKVKNGRGFSVQLTQNLQAFEDVLARGSVTDKQRMLGVIALKYDPAFFPLLEAALDDPVSPVRVQAAAVYTKLQDDVRLKREKLDATPVATTLSDARLQIKTCCEILGSRVLPPSACASTDQRLKSLWATFEHQLTDPDLRSRAEAIFAVGQRLRVVAMSGDSA